MLGLKLDISTKRTLVYNDFFFRVMKKYKTQEKEFSSVNFDWNEISPKCPNKLGVSQCSFIRITVLLRTLQTTEY